jgi:hypothetical protein
MERLTEAVHSAVCCAVRTASMIVDLWGVQWDGLTSDQLEAHKARMRRTDIYALFANLNSYIRAIRENGELAGNPGRYSQHEACLDQVLRVWSVIHLWKVLRPPMSGSLFGMMKDLRNLPRFDLDSTITGLKNEFAQVWQLSAMVVPAARVANQQQTAASADVASLPQAGLDDEDEKILRTMAQSPHRLFALVDFSVSNKTAGQRVKAMIERGWAKRPRGKNGGVQVTMSGLEIARKASIIARE